MTLSPEAVVEAWGGDRSKVREYTTVAEELWHVGMPGYAHEPADSADSIAYLGEAIDVVEHDVAPFGNERLKTDLRGYLEGAGVVRCGTPGHHRGDL